MLTFVVAPIFSIMVTNFYLFIRNNRVYRFRMSLLHQVSDAAQNDIEARREWAWRYEQLSSVSYNKMVLSIKPLRPEVWYEDTSFLKAS